ncbi:hypothetical protein [Pantoea sp. B65]|uniref:hypothetical protein n=1 Tax=Pantoea sp. B65 TaxID=2813359 RepID=UPI0039B54BB7
MDNALPPVTCSVRPATPASTAFCSVLSSHVTRVVQSTAALPAANNPSLPLAVIPSVRSHQPPAPLQYITPQSSNSANSSIVDVPPALFHWVAQNLEWYRGPSAAACVRMLLSRPGIPFKPTAIELQAALGLQPGIAPPGVDTVGNALIETATEARPDVTRWVEENLTEVLLGFAGCAKQAIIVELLNRPGRPSELTTNMLCAILQQPQLRQLLGKKPPGISTIRNAFSAVDIIVSPQLVTWVNTHLQLSGGRITAGSVRALRDRPDRPDELNAKTLYEALRRLKQRAAPGIRFISHAYRSAGDRINAEMQAWVGRYWRQLDGSPEQKLRLLLQQPGRPAVLSEVTLNDAIRDLDGEHAPGAIPTLNALIHAGIGVDAGINAWVSDLWQQLPGESSEKKIVALLQQVDAPVKLNARLLYAALLLLLGDSAPGLSTIHHAFALSRAVADVPRQITDWVEMQLPRVANLPLKAMLLALLQREPKPEGLDARTLYAALNRLQGSAAPGWSIVCSAYAHYTEQARQLLSHQINRRIRHIKRAGTPPGYPEKEVKQAIAQLPQPPERQE